MERLDKIRGDREGRFWEERMKNSEHHKKEMIKSNLIRNETLIADPVIRSKVEDLREERQRKREEKRNRNLNKSRDNNINQGLDQEMDIETEKIKSSKNVQKENVKVSKRKKQRFAQKQKLLNVNKYKITKKKDAYEDIVD